MRWAPFRGARDPEAPPGEWLPRAEVLVAVATVLVAAAVVGSILVSRGHGRTYGAAPAVRAAGGAVPSPAPGALPRQAPMTSVAPTTVAAPAVAPTTSTGPPAPPTPATAPPTTPAPAWGPDPLLARVMPSQADLGAGWAAPGQPSNAAGSPSSGGPCPTDPLPNADAGVALTVGYDDGAHQASATVTLYRTGTAAAIAREQAFTASSNSLPCIDAVAARDSMRYPWLGELEGTEFTEAAARVTLPYTGDSELLTVTANVDGSPQSACWAFAHMYLGRYEALTLVSWTSTKPLPTADLQHFVNVAGASLAKLGAAAA